VQVLVVGGGIFGITAALALRGRGHGVTVVDPGPIPHPLAESTDISKVVRADYGADVLYTELGERALDGWRRWNRAWPRPPFAETGVMFVARAPMAPGGFEYESHRLLTARGHRLERLDADAIAARFPAWRAGVHVDGYWNPSGGYARASDVVAALTAQALAAGVIVREGKAEALTDAGAVVGTAHVRADLVLVCNGSWAAELVPELAGLVRPIGQPVFHLRPADPARFSAARFPVFGADIARTGWYGFPADDRGVVKIANHGVGVPVARDDDRVVSAAQEQAVRAFVADAFPALAGAPITLRRLCVYGDTPDEHFWIARHPERPRVAVATGGSGHAFKFAPVLGDLIADLILDDAAHPLRHRFRWRADALARGEEAARHR
jgi:glycine/D-amino acid oxidase-like deaminating enzyme